jgi:hypothetical protein
MDPERELYSVREGHEDDDEQKLLTWKESADLDYYSKPSLFDRIYRETTETEAELDYFIQPELDSDCSWDDYYSDIVEEKDDDIQHSIDAIKEEASRIDTILAMDQLDTMKQELDEMKRKLRNQNSELAEKRCLIKLKDDRLATLELERDLYKADANKLMQARRRRAQPSTWASRRDQSHTGAARKKRMQHQILSETKER